MQALGEGSRTDRLIAIGFGLLLVACLLFVSAV